VNVNERLDWVRPNPCFLMRSEIDMQRETCLDGTGTDSGDLETDLDQGFSVKDQTTVEDKGGLVHRVVDLLPVQGLEFVPLGSNNNSVGTVTCGFGSLGDLDVLLNGLGGDLSVVSQVEHDSRLGNFGVVDADVGSFSSEVVDQSNSRGFSSVSGVLLESETKNGNFLASDGVEHGVNDLLGESVLLVFVHFNDSVPVLGHSGEMERLAQVDQVQDILRE
jgi:hypothetical protein